MLYAKAPSTVAWLIAAAVVLSILPVFAQDAYGEWEVRRARTVDAERAGGYPAWNVTFSGSEDTPNVRIDGDSGRGVRGSIFIGHRVTVPDDNAAFVLDFAYATRCELENRSGRVDLAILDAEAWDAMSAEPTTTQMLDIADRSSVLAYLTVAGIAAGDLAEPVQIDESVRATFAALQAAYAGRDVVLAVAWTGYHDNVESAEFRGIRIMEVERPDPAMQLFKRLDLEREDMAVVKAAVDAEDFKAASTALVAYFSTRTAPVLPDDPRSKDPKSLTRRLAEADEAMANRFIGQSSYGFQKVPDDIDWAFNPTKDPEWTWQFNRHSAWRALGEAYLHTGDEKYALKWVELMRDWVAENPPGTRHSWRTIEAGIRGQGWPYIYFCFVDSPSFTPADHALFLGALADHAEYLMPEERFHAGSNWGQIESMGLLNMGLFFPEFTDGNNWRDTAWQRIAAEMFNQVLADGAQVELTTSYHQGVMSGFIKAANLAESAGFEVEPRYRERLEKMHEYTMFMSKPDGTQPMVGDSWPGDTRSYLRSGAEMFDRPDMLYVGSAGQDGERPDYLDTALPSAGYYVMRTDWVDPQAIYLLADFAHVWGGGHQHPDAMQVNLYAYGKTLLPDSGSYLYYGEGRKEVSRTDSHSTVTIDETNQNRDGATLNVRFSTEGMSFLDGSHSGYEGVTHRRQILFARPVDDITPYFIVADRITGEGAHTVDQNFHFLPAELEFDAEAMEARTALPAGPNLLIKQLRDAGGSFSAGESWVSYKYGTREPRPMVRYHHEGSLPVTFVTLLVPYPGAQAPDLTASEIEMGGDEGFIGIEVNGAGFTDVVFIGDRPGNPGLEEFDAPALAGIVRYDADGKVLRVVSGADGSN